MPTSQMWSYMNHISESYVMTYVS
ncbi:hypothetical protein F383_31832 [Gossypium arboreum]|uniref:Uncharacterized protein n=1 Tax=Gossypium arboreum TaxID=29729 RepID=A0A0B0N4I8_GOSAR|nr:hypothetical protein F383_31832 [Gossypium arboreum]